MIYNIDFGILQLITFIISSIDLLNVDFHLLNFTFSNIHMNCTATAKNLYNCGEVLYL